MSRRVLGAAPWDEATLGPALRAFPGKRLATRLEFGASQRAAGRNADLY